MESRNAWRISKTVHGMTLRGSAISKTD